MLRKYEAPRCYFCMYRCRTWHKLAKDPRKCVTKSNIWNPNSRKLLPTKRTKSSISGIKHPRKFLPHGTLKFGKSSVLIGFCNFPQNAFYAVGDRYAIFGVIFNLFRAVLGEVYSKKRFFFVVLWWCQWKSSQASGFEQNWSSFERSLCLSSDERQWLSYKAYFFYRSPSHRRRKAPGTRLSRVGKYVTKQCCNNNNNNNFISLTLLVN